jgi:hypothetical protein
MTISAVCHGRSGCPCGLKPIRPGDCGDKLYPVGRSQSQGKECGQEGFSADQLLDDLRRAMERNPEATRVGRAFVLSVLKASLELFPRRTHEHSSLDLSSAAMPRGCSEFRVALLTNAAFWQVSAFE